jgi:hypothetical protein
VKKRRSWKPSFREGLITEAKKYPLLEAITRQLLVKEQQAGKDLAGVVVTCEL